MEDEFESKFLKVLEEDQNDLKEKKEIIDKTEGLSFKRELTKEYHSLMRTIDSLKKERESIENKDSELRTMIENSHYVELKKMLNINSDNEDSRQPWEYGNIFHRLHAIENAEILAKTNTEVLSKIIKQLSTTSKTLDIETEKLNAQIELYANRLPYGKITRYPHDSDDEELPSKNFPGLKRLATFKSMERTVKEQRRLLKGKIDQVQKITDECLKIRKQIIKKAEFLQNGQTEIVNKRLQQKQQLVSAVSKKKNELKEIQDKQKNQEFEATALAIKVEKQKKQLEKDWRNERNALNGQISLLRKQINEYTQKARDDSQSYISTVSEIENEENKNIYTYENAEKALNAELADESILLAIQIEQSRNKQLKDEIESYKQNTAAIEEFKGEFFDNGEEEIISMQQKIKILKDELAFLKKQL